MTGSLSMIMLCMLGIGAWLVALPALSYAWQVPGMLLVGVGLGLTLSPTNTDALGRVATPSAARPRVWSRPSGRSAAPSASP